MNRANPLPPDSKADNSKIERERSVNVIDASVKNKVAVNRAAISKADDKSALRNQTSGGSNSRHFFTSKRASKGETILLCQKKKQSNERAKTSAKANRPVLRLASLYAKKWNTFGKANTAPDRQNKRSPLVSRRRGGRE
jgi:hypothetical protein